MLKFIIPVFIVLLSIGGFFVVIQPLQEEVSVLSKEFAEYNEALSNAKKLETVKGELMKKKNAINAIDMGRLERFLPSAVDNIRLIVEIQEKVALPLGLSLRDIQYNLDEKKESPASGRNVTAGATLREEQKLYGEWGLQFSVEADYTEFVLFLRALEKNLRLIDVISIQFSAPINTDKKEVEKDRYKISFKVKTYWLRN